MTPTVYNYVCYVGPNRKVSTNIAEIEIWGFTKPKA